MFDIGFLELLVIALITLVVMGPERLPEAIRTLSLWIGRLKQLFASAQQELEKEVGMDDIRHQLHNEQVLRELNDQKTELEQSVHASDASQQAKSESTND
jgi:sec-independent protein translocase protein TatB